MNGSLVVDKSYMQRALQLASRGQYTTSPNPNVGCVIVNDKRIVGEGFHQQAGGPHAEVFALKQAGELATGATVYVTLEPCSHYGRTPPCADALVAANVARVVIAMQDPNPQVAGRGVHRLQAAGIEVECGVCSDEAESINRGFLKRMRHSLPFVTVKLAASVDGRTALGNGASQWITGEAARKDVQFERARSCAILTGADTVLADDPQLNVRLQKTELFSPEFGELDIRQPLVVIVDSKNRISPELTLFDSERTIIIANFEANPAFTTDKVCKANVIQWQLDTIGYHLNLQTLMRKLAEFGVNSVWCEAGERLSGAMLEAQLVDELIVYQAPKLMGPAAKPLVSTPDYSSMAEIPQFQFSKVEIIGDDIKLVLNQQSS